MRKITTFIVITLIGSTLTGCGNKRNESYDELYNLYINLDERLQEQEKASETTETRLEEMSKEISTFKQKSSVMQKEEAVVSKESDNVETTTQKVEYKVQNISLQEEKIQVSVLYNNASIPINAYNETERDNAINNPYSLIVPASGQLRDISFIISGITVKSVYVVNSKFEELENIEYSSVDNTYSFYYYMPIGGQYTFLITTVNGTHYYVSVLY